MAGGALCLAIGLHDMSNHIFKGPIFRMNSLQGSRFSPQTLFAAVLGFCVVLVVAKAVAAGLDMHENFAGKGNDDIMRLLSVRDWIAGQGWYDVVQYRLLPPEGVPLHWSRYVDVGIAAIIVPLSWVLPMDTAEQLAATIWPTVILLLSVLVVGFGTRRVFGVLAACFAMLCLVLWPLTADLHSSAGNLDHHNVQLLTMIVLAFVVIWPDRPVAAGLAGGIAAGFSLAVGLEGLPFIVGAGLAVLLRALFLPTPATRQLLVVFCAALVGASLLFWAGQTAPRLWAAPVCDQLGTPVLGLIGIAAVASVLPLAWVRGPWTHLALTVGLTAIGIAVAWPLISGCLDGPYGDLPKAVQDMISNRITEAKPALLYVQTNPGPTLVFVLPLFAALVFGGLQLRKKAGRDADNHALALLLLLALVGTAMIFVQMRTVIMPAAVVPMIGGVVIARLTTSYLQSRDLAQGLLTLLVAVAIVSPTLILQPLWPLLRSGSTVSGQAEGNCDSYASLTRLNAVPPGLVLTHLNFGPALIWATHHKGLSAPYHRSAAALTNGVVPFQLDSAEMAAYLRGAGATHLLLCRGFNYDGAFANELAAGGTADWLRRVPVSDDAQVLFEVLP